MKIYNNKNNLINIAINRVLSNYNFKKYSKYYGNFDRNFWHTKTISDFPSSTYQQTILGITKYCIYLEEEKKKNNILIKKLNSIIKNSILNWCYIQNPDGSQNEYYKNDRSFCPTSFTTFAISKSFILKKNLFNFEEKKTIKEKIKKSSIWICKNMYYESCNQLLAAHNALYFSYLILKNKDIKKKYNSIKNKIIHLSNSGNLKEYGGYDTGYIFISLDLIYEFLLFNKDKEIIKLANHLCRFLTNFLHPDGTSGGAYNSRNTTHIMPFACLIHSVLKSQHSKNLYIWFRDHEKSIVYENPLKINDKYFCYFYFNSIINYFLTTSSSINVKQKELKNNDNFFDEKSGMGKIKIGSLLMFFNLKKNICFKVFKKNKLIIDEEGFNIYNKQKIFTSQCLSENLFKKSITNNKKINITTEGKLQKIKDFIPLENYMVSFKFFSKYILNNKFFSILFNRFIKKKFLKNKNLSNIKLVRNLTIQENKIEIIDKIDITDSKSTYKFNKIEHASETYSDSSNFFESRGLEYLINELYSISYKPNKMIIKRKFKIG